MFSRSDNTEETVDPIAEPSGQRSPMVLAALAGLLAIAGAFLLVWYVSSGSDDVATSTDATTTPAEANRQVLVVVETIPRNTSVSELIEAPTVYLSARAVPEQFVAESAITSVAELRELEGMVLASDALATYRSHLPWGARTVAGAYPRTSSSRSKRTYGETKRIRRQQRQWRCRI